MIPEFISLVHFTEQKTTSVFIPLYKFIFAIVLHLLNCPHPICVSPFVSTNDQIYTLLSLTSYLAI